MFVRVRLDAELKSLVATATEKARAERGDRAADAARIEAAQANSGSPSRRAA